MEILQYMVVVLLLIVIVLLLSQVLFTMLPKKEKTQITEEKVITPVEPTSPVKSEIEVLVEQDISDEERKKKENAEIERQEVMLKNSHKSALDKTLKEIMENKHENEVDSK